jgi:hypothetical protein
MLANMVNKATLTAQSVVEVVTADGSKNLAIETYVCSVDTANPENMTITKTYASTEGKNAYENYREQCRADYAEFQNMAYALQDEMFAKHA